MTTSRFLNLAAAGGALACLLFLPAELLAQKKKTELPITTSSKEALALFQQARDKADNAEVAAAAPLLDQAIQKDPTFVGALAGIGHNYVFKGDYPKARESYQRGFDQAPNINGKMGAMFWKAVSYVHEGNTDEALKSLAEARALAEKENQAPALINTHLQAAFILAETGQLAKSVKYLEKAATALDQSALPPPTKDALRLTSMEGRAYVLAAVHEFDAARALAEKCRALVEARKNAYEERALHTLLAQIALEEGKYEEALEHFAKADQEDPYNWFYKALTLDRKGDKAAASALYAKVAGWNQNGLDYALVRSRALKQTASR